jgi:hypothetical protein
VADIQRVAQKRFTTDAAVFAAPEYPAVCIVVQAGQNSEKRGFTGAVRALDTGQSTGQYGERQVPEKRTVVPLTMQIDSL